MTEAPRGHGPGRGRVAVVTDSTSYLPTGTAETLDVRVVPLQVIVGGKVRAEGAGTDPAVVVEALRAGKPVSTSRPSPSLFAETYSELLAAGAGSIVSVHLSGAMSGTVEAARVAEGETDGDVVVVDSRTIAMGLGFAVIAAAEAGAEGADSAAVADAARARARETRTLFCVETLEFLRRGGRIGTARALLGSALSVKPLLHIEDGRIGVLERVRTTSRAVARLQDIVVEAAGSDPVAIAVHHLGAPARAAALAAELDARVPKLADLSTSELGAVVGAHTGPGTLGVVVSRC